MTPNSIMFRSCERATAALFPNRIALSRRWLSKPFTRPCFRPRARAKAPTIYPSPRVALSSFSTSSSEGDAARRRANQMIREAFDEKPHGSNPHSASYVFRGKGLARNRFLDSPEGYREFAQRNLAKAAALFETIRQGRSEDELRRLVGRLDRLSDLLCRVLDLCDFVRLVHPDARHRGAAGEAWDSAYLYMNHLNTQPDLYDRLREALASDAVRGAWAEDEMMVATTLKVDFEKSAVHLSEENRRRFVDVSQKISETGSQFLSTMSPRTAHLDIPTKLMGGSIAGGQSKIGRRYRLFAGDGSMNAALTVIQDSDLRKKVYLAANTASADTLALLEQLVAYRAELASITGFESYALQHLKDRMMADTPTAVYEFLMALHRSNAPMARQCADMMTSAKRAEEGLDDVKLNPWDVAYYKASLNRLHEQQPSAAAIFPRLSVGQVMQGLSELFHRMYGIRFQYRDAEPGEIWHRDVRCLDVLDESGRIISVIYCDLYDRPDKSPNAAHYTLRCSRTINEDEVVECQQEQQEGTAGGQQAGWPNSPSRQDLYRMANDGMAVVEEEDATFMQAPTIALVCSFNKPAGSSSNAPTHSQVVTLFHEMGHAVHSILARTRFQNVAGTRCATDLAEVPSTLMEHFATNPAVLGLFTDSGDAAAIDPQQLAKLGRGRRLFDALETERQIVLALLDQKCHSIPAASSSSSSATPSPPPPFNSTAVYHDIQKRVLRVACPDHQSTSWHGFFGHLHGYGGAYYSYLLDRVLADRIWGQVFDAGRGDAALSRERGEALRRKLLRWGGGRDPWLCIADVLGDDRLAKGGREAMRIVGGWGTMAKIE